MHVALPSRLHSRVSGKEGASSAVPRYTRIIASGRGCDDTVPALPSRIPLRICSAIDAIPPGWCGRKTVVAGPCDIFSSVSKYCVISSSSVTRSAEISDSAAPSDAFSPSMMAERSAGVWSGRLG